MAESRSITFTCFDLDIELLKSKLESLQVTYAIIGKESCPDTQRKHLQCYAQFGKKFTFNKIAKTLLCHCEIPLKSPEENVAYCKKGGEYIEIGSLRGVSKVSAQKDRWSKILHLAKEGKIDNIEEEFPSAAILHRKTLNQIKDESVTADHHPDRICVWIWGKSGVGKTRWAHDNFPEKDIFILSDTDGWDLYNQERIALLDEADEEVCKQ